MNALSSSVDPNIRARYLNQLNTIQQHQMISALRRGVKEASIPKHETITKGMAGPQLVSKKKRSKAKKKTRRRK